MKIFHILLMLLLGSFIGIHEVLAEEQKSDLWFVGKDLSFHDYYKYNICMYDDKNVCDPFEIFLWVKSDLPDKWIFEVLIDDDENKKIRGQIDLDKNSLTLTSNDEIREYMNPIYNFFNLYHVASIDNPQNLNHTNWKNTLSGNREINLQISRSQISDNIGQLYSLQSIDGILFTNDPILLSEEIPFPVKANYTIIDQDFLQFDDKRTCNDGGVLVLKIDEKSNQCINFVTAYQWAESGLIQTPNVGFELLEFRKHTNFVPSFLSYEPSIDNDTTLTYGSRVLSVQPRISSTSFPLPPNGTAIGISLLATHSDGITVKADYLDLEGNLKRMHYPLSNNKPFSIMFEVRNFTKVWADNAYLGGLVNIQYIQSESEIYRGDYPKVDAGNDQVITNQEFVTLNGTKTTHPLGNDMTYRWSIVNSDITLDTSSFNYPLVTFPISEIKTSGSATFRLTATDARIEHLSDSDDIVIFFDFSPLHQIKNGVHPNDVICNDDLELILKLTNDLPACVTPETAEKLIERGWLIPQMSKVQSDISKVTVTNVCNPKFQNKIIPETIRVLLNVNSTIQWTNYGSCGQIIEHVVEYGASDKEQTKRLYGGDSDTITYFEKGIYNYHLKHHTEFKGTVIVE